MAFRPGKDAYVSLTAASGSVVNISGYADSVTFPQNVDTHDVSVFGTTAKQYVPGMTDGGEISISGPLDVAFGTFVAGLRAAHSAGSAAGTFVWGPAGSISGQIKQTAYVWLSSYEVTTSVGGRVEYSASMQVTGTVANGTW
jgi:hypothetical protein